MCAVIFCACEIDTSAPTGNATGEVNLTSTADEGGGLAARVRTHDGQVLLTVDYDPSTNLVTVRKPNEEPFSFENAAYGASVDGVKLAAWFLYHDSLGLRDQPGCDPPANLMTTVCLSHMCAVHDQCFFDNPDKDEQPCVGSVANFWQSAKAWAWGNPSYCDICNINAMGETLKSGMYGCELSGECNGWECGCDAKQCTVDGATVCLSSGDCHELKNSQW